MIPGTRAGWEIGVSRPAADGRAWVSSVISRLTVPCLCCLLLSCNGKDPNAPRWSEGQLTLVTSFSLDIDELSGLALDASGTSLWTVGARRVYRLSLGGQVQKLDFKGDNLEGIASDPSDGTLWVVEEKRREILHLDGRGEVLARRQLDLEGKESSGPEGICLDPSGAIFVLNEKNPGLFVTLAADLSIASQRELDFAKDFSGLDCDGGSGRFWVVSDQSRMLFLWSPDTGVISAYPLPFDKAEGVAVDASTGQIYIVSESESRLYVYSVEFPE